ncbi:MAG: LptE family protein [Bacteroidales bacterium]|nr:LptE family protein [Bacteroidales bacterium]
MSVLKSVIFAFLVFVPVLQGCKMSYSFTGASIPPEAKTVSVQLFQNLASIVNPSLNTYLTEEVKNRFISQTRLGVVNEFGDFAFSGQITQYNVAPIAIQGNEVAAQNRLTISVKVKFVNAIDPKLSYDKTFTQYENFESSQNFSSIESSLVTTIVEKLVDDIFNAAAANW